MPPARRAAGGLTVAVTGPTGEIGKPFVAALEKAREVKRIIGMARRPSDPAEHGWKRTEYRRGDVLDRAAVEGLVADADVVVHLAFIVVQASSETRHINVEGSRNVFEAAVQAGAKRLVYASSVAAYGFPEDVDGLLTEEMPARGHERHPYSAHKAEVEAVLSEALDGGDTDAYVFRPCIVAGPQAPMLVNAVPHLRLRRRLPGVVRPLLVLPDPGVPLPARPPRRRRGRAACGRARPRDARRLQPRRAGRADDARPRHGARAAHGAGPAAGGRSGLAHGRALPVGAGGGDVDRGRAPAGPDGHGEGAPRAALAPAARRARDAARDGGGGRSGRRRVTTR
jgi:putative NADH-flavin reductase